MNRSRIIAALLGIFVCPLWAEAQHSLSGKVADASGSALQGVMVVLLHSPDSTLENFTNTDSLGHFQFKKLAKGTYILQCSFLGFVSDSRKIELDQEADTDMGLISLKPVDKQLSEVVIGADKIPVRINGDTIEYNAGSFKTAPNAVVEDLLKKLPGVEVEKDGTVKAQGKTVSKVLVDGKEFFGDDPKIATKNLPADAVDQVQVFDKKGELAEFTGIDDGEEDRTINLKLKEEKKKGAFGRVSAGYGTKDRYEGKGNVNYFKKRFQVSALASANNTNQQGFSVMDYVNFMGGFRNLMSGGQGGSMSLNTNDMGAPLNMSSNDGFTTVRSGGLNFNVDPGAKTEVRSSIFYNRLYKDVRREAFRQNVAGNGYFNTNENSLRTGANTNSRLNLVLKHRMDSTQKVVWKNDLALTGDNGFSEAGQYSFYPGDSVNTSNESITETENDGYKLSSTLTYLKRLGTKGRNIAADLNASMRAGSGNTLLYSLRQSVNGSSSVRDTINQQQKQAQATWNYGYKLAYTEPLGKSRFLELSYAWQETPGSLDKDFIDIYDDPERTEVYNPFLSNRYSSTYQYHRAGTSVRQNRKKHQLMAGLSWQQSSLKDSAGERSGISRSFTYFLPRFSWTFKPAQAKSLQFRYQTSVREPSGDQLQPVVNNTNPLYVTTGNPDLQPEYQHNGNLHLNIFDQFSFTSFFGMLNATYTQNKITTLRTIGSDLVTVSKPVNVEEELNLNAYTSFSTPIKFMKALINSSVNSTYSKSILFVNSIRNHTHRWTNSFDLSLENRKKDHFDAQIGMRWSPSTVRYSVSSDQNTRFFTTAYYLDLEATLPKNWSASSSFNYTVYSGAAFAQEEVIPLWNASVSKQFLKNNRAELKLSAIDLLDKNKGFRRSSTENYIQEETTRSIGRYFLLGLTYSLSKFPVSNGGMDIRMRGHGR